MRPELIFEILYGGARGGGKTDAGIYWLIKPEPLLDGALTISHDRFRALVLRRNANDLTDWLDRAERTYKHFGGVLKDRNKAPFFLFESGAKIMTGHLKDEESYAKYQGQEFQRIVIEELTQIKSELLYTKLIGSCRSTVAALRPQVFLTTNPGGRGHGWVRRRFITNHIPNYPFTSTATDRGAIYIPARVEDNPILTTTDPDYVKQLEAIKTIDPKLYQAWRNGEWDAFEGQVFSEWNYNTHVFSQFPFRLADCKRICSFDWGYRAPASMHWLAYTPENQYGVRHVFVYREIYRNQLTPKQWGQLLKRIQMIDPVEYMALPHDCYSSDQGQDTIATVLKRESGIPDRPAKTLVKGARQNRLALTHQGLSMSPDGHPYMMVHESCMNLIRTLPELPYSETAPEDVDTEAEDHAYDSMSTGLITLKPRFTDAMLVELKPRVAIDLKQSWQQNSDGSTQPLDIIQALGSGQRTIQTDGEF